MRASRLVLIAFLIASGVTAQQPSAQRVYTRADTLRGSNGPGRAWWDAEFYDLHVTVHPADSSIRGWNGITYRVLAPGRVMQIDLQVPLQIDSVVHDRRKLAFRRDSNVFFVTMPAQRTGARGTVTVYYNGKPRAARRAPWDGGFVWQRDSVGNRHIATANQGLGASVWWPNKDYGADEPDSQRVAITVPDSLVNVSNGRLRSVSRNANGSTTWEWFVSNPINNYGIAVNAGRYAHFTDYYQGEGGTLTMDYYPLAIHEDTARVQFRQARSTIACFEHWFGPYPWYEDGFKLVETPHLGMEHQSAVAYGNKYKNGYLGRDLSKTGWGLKWDFIIVHETAHEWWANNITAKDLADMWVHESFANYAEGLYTECTEGAAAGAEYIIGSRGNIQNDRPIIPPFGVNAQGSGDMYPKGGNMLHTIRHVIADDAKWRGILRGANKTFWHKTIDGKELQEYISREAKIDFTRVFEQYLTTTKVPVLEYKVENGTLSYRWANVVAGFDMPVDVAFPDAPAMYRRIHPTTDWKSLPATAAPIIKRDFYVELKAVRRVGELSQNRLGAEHDHLGLIGEITSGSNGVLQLGPRHASARSLGGQDTDKWDGLAESGSAFAGIGEQSAQARRGGCGENALPFRELLALAGRGIAPAASDVVPCFANQRGIPHDRISDGMANREGTLVAVQVHTDVACFPELAVSLEEAAGRNAEQWDGVQKPLACVGRHGVEVREGSSADFHLDIEAPCKPLECFAHGFGGLLQRPAVIDDGHDERVASTIGAEGDRSFEPDRDGGRLE